VGAAVTGVAPSAGASVIAIASAGVIVGTGGAGSARAVATVGVFSAMSVFSASSTFAVFLASPVVSLASGVVAGTPVIVSLTLPLAAALMTLAAVVAGVASLILVGACAVGVAALGETLPAGAGGAPRSAVVAGALSSSRLSNGEACERSLPCAGRAMCDCEGFEAWVFVADMTCGKTDFSLSRPRSAIAGPAPDWTYC
jgi:hypothetical protein